VAAAAAFFGSPEASYVTGQHIGINGGMAMLGPNMRMRRVSPGQV
jgi:NAD(P)-dependent dehydrogenase (short-subunit alcohol dehydrogenase family)